MFALAIFIGMYSYGIFGLGMLGILTKPNLLGFTISWLLLVIIFSLGQKLKFRPIRLIRSIRNLSKFESLILVILATQLLINLIGALGPELGFDALWYHLTLPKIWLTEGIIRFLPGSIFKYSVMPKLVESLYVFPLAFFSEIGAKLIHYLFGVLSLIVTYKISKKLLPSPYSLLPLIILSGNLVFSWQQTTAYIDLARTFFEILALKLFIDRKIIPSAITLGLAISTKLLALISLPIFIILLLKEKFSLPITIYYLLFTILIPLPWLILSVITTGNPIFPFFSPQYPLSDLSFNPLDIVRLFTNNPDPVSPVYLITAPLLFLFPANKWGRGERVIYIYCLLAILFWFFTPRTGGGRFILPYLPAFSIATVLIINKLSDKFIKNFLIFLTLTLTLTSIIYRGLANLKYLPVISGAQTKSDFLSQNLNFSFGDYFDTDNWLASRLPPGTPVYTVGINNLYYLNYPFTFPQADYLLLRYTEFTLPPRFSDWLLLHANPQTGVKIYSRLEPEPSSPASQSNPGSLSPRL
jgi:hypothetical protein